MRFVYGLVGAIIGALVGGAATLLILTAIFVDAFLAIMIGWVGLIIGAITGIVVSQLVWRHIEAMRSSGASSRKAGLILACWVFGPFLPIALGVACSWCSKDRARMPPSDATMIGHFMAHRADFERLARMDRASNAGTATSSQMANYWRLLRRLNCSVEHSGPQSDGDEFGYWNFGDGMMFADEINKGYVYAVKPPAPLMKSPDTCASDGEKSVQAYRHITGNWYLFYEYEPE